LISQSRGLGDVYKRQEYVYVQLSKYVIYIVVFYLCLQELDINPGVFLGGSAALLVGLGLGLQDVFKDWFSGIILLFEGSLKIGDIIELQDSKFKEPIVAKILKINVRTTQIETRDGNILLIPNAKLTQEYVENWSHGNDLSRFLINITVAYGSDTEKVIALLKQAAMSHPKVNKSHPVQVRMRDFGDKGLDLELVFWADQGWDASNYKSEIRFEIDRLFRQYAIEIPFPRQNIQVNTKQSNA
jgi:small-conductance mechanosensitive channel